MKLFLTRPCVAVAGGALLLAAAVAHGQSVEVSYTGPTLDRWMYPFNGTPGIRPFVSVFGASGETDFDDRDGQMIIGFDTEADVTPGLGAGSYTISSATVTVMYDGQVEYIYDPTSDPWQAFLPADDPEWIADEDLGQPVELFGLGYRNDFDVFSFAENSPYGGLIGTDIRNAHALGYDEFGEPRDVSNHVRDRFDPKPWAVGQIEGATSGLPVEPLAEIVFEIDVADLEVQAYLGEALDAGRLRLALTSLHLVAQQAGSFPTIFTKENGLVIDGLAAAARLDLVVEIEDSNSADINGDGVVDVADLVEVILAWGACACPADVNGDGIVDVSDLVEVIIAWS